MSTPTDQDRAAAKALLSSLSDAPDATVDAIAGHLARLRERAVDRICEVHEQADEETFKAGELERLLEDAMVRGYSVAMHARLSDNSGKVIVRMTLTNPRARDIGGVAYADDAIAHLKQLLVEALYTNAVHP